MQIFTFAPLINKMEARKVRVRFAPSPTGPLHMGGVRTALYNYLFAKKHNGDFILRIEDTDQTRFVPGAEEYIINALKWCGIEPNEGVGFGDGAHAPYRQSERKQAGTYKQYADQLVNDGYAYYAFDTSEELDAMRQRLEAAKAKSSAYNIISRQTMKNSLTLPADEVKARLESGDPYVIRIKIPRNEEIRVKDIIRGWVVVNSNELDDKVLYKSDGMPTYHLANIVDDYLMKISHVIRGEEWLPSAPLHVLLYRFLGWESVMPEFAHLPLLLKPDGNGKLSKRDGDRLGFPVFPLDWVDPFTGEKSSGYKEKGYYSAAFLNILALLGWNPGNNEELLSKEALIEAFSLERVSKSGAKFDPEKTKWFNQQYLRLQSNEDLAAIFIKEIEAKGISTSLDFVTKICNLIKEKAHFNTEFWSLSSYFFTEPTDFDAEVIKKKWKPEIKEFLNAFSTALSSGSALSALELETLFKETATSLNMSPGQVMQIYRVAISGVGGGPAIFEVSELLGTERIKNRISVAVNSFDKVLA